MFCALKVFFFRSVKVKLNQQNATSIKCFLSNIVAMYRAKKGVWIFFVLVTAFAQAQQVGTGQWRIHLPFNNTAGIAETPRYVYSWANFGFYRYDKETNASERLSKIQGFSDIAVSYIAYNSEKDLLVVAYQDANIDLVRNGQIINLNDVQRAFINGDRTVKNILFEGDYAYLACTFGIIKMDVEKLEISASYINLDIGDINDVSLWNNQIFAATSKGIYNAPLIGVNLLDPTSWAQFDTGATRMLRLFDNKLFAMRTSSINYYDGSTWNTLMQSGFYNSLFATTNNLYISRRDTLITVDKSLNTSSQFINTLKTARIGFDGSIWYTTDNSGTIQQQQNGKVVFTAPNGPYNLRTGLMASIDDEVIVAGGQIGGNYTFTYSLNGYYRYVDDKWINSLENSNPATDSLRDFYAVTTDPKTKDVWLGAYWQGLVRVNGGEVKEIYNPNNSSLRLGIINFIAGLAVDKNGHLWVANYGADSALVVRTKTGDWKALSLGNINTISQIVVDDKNRKWIVAPRNNGFGLLVYDDDNAPLNPNKHLGPKILNTNEGQGGLPDNQVNCIAKDLDGEIWVGTLKGPAVFSNPSNIFSAKPSDARQIVIGEGRDIGYLLGNEVINSIYVDGGNRKWMGTNNGAWLVAADGQEILANFNVDNSPLFSNNVMQITVNEKTGEVFFATDRGILSYKGDATVATQTHSNVLVYPNPVREDFDGPISIRGLAQDANVKITDIAGNLIYETRANGGMATWDGRNFSGRKASTGVYLIFSGTDDASDTYVAKVLVINSGK